MMRAFAQHLEKILLAVAGLLLAGVGLTWMMRLQAGLARVDGEAEGVVLTGAPLAFALTASAPGHPVWDRPPAQTSGSGWVYEVFTPPIIYYHATARSFAVTPPHYAAEATDPVLGFELLEVRRAPYRLQLAGYVGAPGDYLAAFVSEELPQTLLARAGHRFEQLDLTLKSVEVRKVAVPGNDAVGVGYDVAAFAILHDGESGTEVVLDNRAPRLTDTSLAVFQALGGKGRARALREGDTFSDDAAAYRIMRIQLDPPEVVVARTAPGVPVPELRVLRPAGDVAVPVAVRDKPQPETASSPAPGFARHDPR